MLRVARFRRRRVSVVASSTAAHAVLSNAPLLRMIVLFQRGLPRDMVNLMARSFIPHDTLPQLAVRRQDLRLLERLWRCSREQPEYFRQQPRLTFNDVWLESVRGGNAEITTWIDAHAFRPDEIDAGKVWTAFVIQSRSVAMVGYVTAQFPQLKREVADAVTSAIKRNAVNILLWLDTNVGNAPYPPHAHLIAVNSGSFDALTHLHGQSPAEAWPRAVMDLAASLGHFEMLRFLHEHRADGCTTVAMDMAAARGHLEVVQFLHEQRTEGCTTAAMDGAAANGYLQVVQFLHAHRTEGCTTAAMNGAAANGHFAVVQYLHTHRTEGCTSALSDAAANGHAEVVQFLLEHRTEGYKSKILITPRDKIHSVVSQVRRRVTALCLDDGHLRELARDNVVRSMTLLSASEPPKHRMGDSSHFTIVQALHHHRIKNLVDVAWLELTEAGHERVIASFRHQPRLVFEAAANKGDLGVVQFLHLHFHAKYCSNNACFEAAERGQTSVVAFLLQHCTSSDSVGRVLCGAINSGDLATTQCVAERCSRDELVGAHALAVRRHLDDIVEYLTTVLATKKARTA